MIHELVEALRSQSGVCLYPGIESDGLARFQKELGLVLPRNHRQFLQLTNGFESYDGYERLFGVSQQASINSSWWNHPDCWKFAWSGLADNYWCFGENAWGTQYAYALDELRTNEDPPVYILTSVDMHSQPGASSFADHIAKMIRGPRLDGFDLLCKEKYPRLQPAEHLKYLVPMGFFPPGRRWDVDLVTVVNSRVAMIANGDAHFQANECPDGYTLERIDVVLDERNRPRIKLIWCPDPEEI